MFTGRSTVARYNSKGDNRTHIIISNYQVVSLYTRSDLLFFSEFLQNGEFHSINTSSTGHIIQDILVFTLIHICFPFNNFTIIIKKKSVSFEKEIEKRPSFPSSALRLRDAVCWLLNVTATC